MIDVAAERQAEYIDALDADDPLNWFPPSFDEWSAIKRKMGSAPGDFLDYLRELNRAGNRQCYEALTFFGAIDDDDYVPQMEELS